MTMNPWWAAEGATLFPAGDAWPFEASSDAVARRNSLAKKSWSEPALIVLVRGKPEEAISATCKAIGTGSAPHDHETGCDSSSCTGDSPS